MIETLEQALGLHGALFLVGLISGVFPLMNAELVVIATATVVADVPTMLGLGALAALGQSLTFCALFQLGHGAAHLRWLARPVAKAKARVAGWRRRRLAVLGASALLGLPPHLLVSLVAGALEIRFPTFVAVTVAARTTRFLVVAAGAAYAAGG